LLLDEIEKAHPDVFNILLQVLDDGRLTDGHGRAIDFRNTVIVMTSNLGSDSIHGMAEDTDYERMREAVMEVVRRSFRPEFINRIDELVVFHSLKTEQIRAIAELQIEFLRQRLVEQDLNLVMSTRALDRIGEAGFDPVYGARPLKRAIQTLIETPLAQGLLEDNFRPGEMIHVDTNDRGEYSFTGREEDAA
ncbi:MAG: AAA family ATPase, partial [Gammaproteobacteria bacterium]